MDSSSRKSDNPSSTPSSENSVACSPSQEKISENLTPDYSAEDWLDL